MREIEFTRAALADLAGIARESEKTWGEVQREKYLGEITDQAERLAVRPLLGPLYGSSRPGLRRLRVGSHIIFFYVEDARIQIVRVLHQRMDVERHLRGLPSGR